VVDGGGGGGTLGINPPHLVLLLPITGTHNSTHLLVALNVLLRPHMHGWVTLLAYRHMKGMDVALTAFGAPRTHVRY
jgi:hypothetical protein